MPGNGQFIAIPRGVNGNPVEHATCSRLACDQYHSNLDETGKRRKLALFQLCNLRLDQFFDVMDRRIGCLLHRAL